MSVSSWHAASLSLQVNSSSSSARLPGSSSCPLPTCDRPRAFSLQTEGALGEDRGRFKSRSTRPRPSRDPGQLPFHIAACVVDSAPLSLTHTNTGSTCLVVVAPSLCMCACMFGCACTHVCMCKHTDTYPHTCAAQHTAQCIPTQCTFAHGFIYTHMHM